jgi:ABC-type bacteriocin/lantibiotic exporter with double-glycine peptidase domain
MPTVELRAAGFRDCVQLATSGIDQPGKGQHVALRNVYRSFDGREVLRGISVDITAGQFVTVVGRSAAARRPCCG